ncbi:MAG: vitamin K epoxide reductase family protein [Candidatus Marinimicrobia bacterium]|nr:vitamin K epoxide reductase family protein [Candidatus Neomarinimicrobiota bacterium]
MTIPHYLSPITTILLFILAGLGWTLSFYFYGVYKKFITDMVWWIPPQLQMAKCRCKDIVDTKFGKILGQSNSFWGMWYYLALIFITAFTYFTGVPPFSWIFGLSIIALLFTLYLSLGLYRLNVLCRTCLGVHGVNVAVFVVTGIHLFM